MTTTSERHADKSHNSKTAAETVKAHAAHAVGDLKRRNHDGKDRIEDSVHQLGKKIEDRPLWGVAIALGIGYLLARLLHPKRKVAESPARLTVPATR
ncbi:MAG: hypothetical protein ABSF29_11890 [Tepidisphaeraceae bacterium]